MFQFHKDKNRYFQIQYEISKRYIIPFVSKIKPIATQDRILEIWCAEAGVLKAFLENGNHCVGVELRKDRLELAKEFLKEYDKKGQVELVDKKIEDLLLNNNKGFDLIILKDVIEHIHHQEIFIRNLKSILNPDALIFFAFPPWQMPFGGHQQVLENRWGSKIPWTHFLPRPFYKAYLRLLGESPIKIQNVMEIKQTGISIDRFIRICKKANFQIVKKQGYLLNPIYQFKFGWPTIRQHPLIFRIPILRNFVSSCAYFLIKAK